MRSRSTAPRITGVEVRDAMEGLDLNAERLSGLGFDGFTGPVKITCADHENNGPVMIQEWDGSSWSIVQTGIEASCRRGPADAGRSGGEGSGEVRLRDAGELHLTGIPQSASHARWQRPMCPVPRRVCRGAGIPACADASDDGGR